MVKAVYFDLFAGCSGDMVLGALLDCGLPLEQLAEKLAALPISGYRITQKKVKRGAVSATLAQVSLETDIKQPDRSYTDIVNLISSSGLRENVKRQAAEIFRNLGEAEAKIHGVSLDKVHFHEVGAVDSIIDIIGAVIGFDLLGITHFYSSPFPVASGSIECRHGVLPLPAPATLELISAKNSPTIKPAHAGMEGKELVTPTGAAIITSLADFETPSLKPGIIGYGAGSRNPAEYPNILRIWIGETIGGAHTGGMVLLETNIDDMNPQIYEYVMEKLFKQGALDVWFTPIQMKKNRPAIMLSVLAEDKAETAMVEILMRETSTLGVRSRPISRHIAEREIIDLDSRYGRVRVKVKRFADGILSVAPEYDDCKRIAAEKEIPLKDVYRNIEEDARPKFI